MSKQMSRMADKNHIFTIDDGRVKIKGIFIGLPIEEAAQALSEQGFTVDDSASTPYVFKGSIPGLGVCSLLIREGINRVGMIVIRTERECTEDEALDAFEQLKNELHAEPGFDYNGYGIAPKPHEIDHFWDLDEGLVRMRWDGFNTQEFSFKNSDGLDQISLWVGCPVVKDEAYWRSEVD